MGLIKPPNPGGNRLEKKAKKIHGAGAGSWPCSLPALLQQQEFRLLPPHPSITPPQGCPSASPVHPHHIPAGHVLWGAPLGISWGGSRGYWRSEPPPPSPQCWDPHSSGGPEHHVRGHRAMGDPGFGGSQWGDSGFGGHTQWV